MADIYDCTQVILCHHVRVGIRINVYDPENNIGQAIDNEDYRSHQTDKNTDDRGIEKRNLLRMYRGHGLWRNLAEEQDQQGKDTAGNCYHRTAQPIS